MIILENETKTIRKIYCFKAKTNGYILSGSGLERNDCQAYNVPYCTCMVHNLEMRRQHRGLLVAALTVTGIVILYRLLRNRVNNSLSFIISKTWNGRPIAHEPAHLKLLPGQGCVEIHVTAPFFNNPPAPTGKPGEPFPQLWDYEVVEAFFLSDSNKYLEVELCPYGQHLVLMLDGRRNMIKDQLPIKFTCERSNGHWTGTAYIPYEYFPPSVTKFNAYAIHGSGQDRQYEAYMTVPGNEPDFHRLEYFEPINFTLVNPENSSPTYKSRYWQV